MIKLHKNEGIKGFDSDFSCRGFQYEVGKNYRINPKNLVMCGNGFHFCKKPEHVFDWYGGENARYAIIRHGKNTIHGGNKSVTSSLTILKEINKEEIVNYCERIEATKKQFFKNNKGIIQEVYEMLRDREINPRGEFDKGGRWYAAHNWAINVRTPSAAWPYSEMIACRTKKYVQTIAWEFQTTNKEELLKNV